MKADKLSAIKRIGWVMPVFTGGAVFILSNILSKWSRPQAYLLVSLIVTGAMFLFFGLAIWGMQRSSKNDLDET